MRPKIYLRLVRYASRYWDSVTGRRNRRLTNLPIQRKFERLHFAADSCRRIDVAARACNRRCFKDIAIAVTTGRGVFANPQPRASSICSSGLIPPISQGGKRDTSSIPITSLYDTSSLCNGVFCRKLRRRRLRGFLNRTGNLRARCNIGNR